MSAAITISDDEEEDKQEKSRSMVSRPWQEAGLASVQPQSGHFSRPTTSSASRTVTTPLHDSFSRSDLSRAEKKVNSTASVASKFTPSSREALELSQGWPSVQRETVVPVSSSVREVIDLTGEDSYERAGIGSPPPIAERSARQRQQSPQKRTRPWTEPEHAFESLEGINSHDLAGTARSKSRTKSIQLEAGDNHHSASRLREKVKIGVSSNRQTVEARSTDASSTPFRSEWMSPRATEKSENIAYQNRSTPRPKAHSPLMNLSDRSARGGEIFQSWANEMDQPRKAVGLPGSPKISQHGRSEVRKMQRSPRPHLKLNGPKRDPPEQQPFMHAGHTTSPLRNRPYSNVKHINAIGSSERPVQSHGDRPSSLEDGEEQTSTTESESDDANITIQRSINQASALYKEELDEDIETPERLSEERCDQNVPQETAIESAHLRQQSKPPSALGSPELGERPSDLHETDNIDRLPENGSELEGHGADCRLHSEPVAALDDESPSPSLPPVGSPQQAAVHGGLGEHTKNDELPSESVHPPNGRGNVVPDMKILESIFKPLVEEMRAGQEYLVAGILSRARKGCIEHPGPKLDLSLSDPFTAATISNAQPIPFNPLRRVHMDSRVSNARMKPPPIESQAIAFKSEAQRLPRYNSIIRLGSNLLAPNDKDLRYLPYFPSEEDKDGEETANHKRREELLEGFDNRIKFLPEERKCAEQAELWREHVEYFLEEVGCTCADVMFYLLHDEDAQWKPKCELSEEALLQWQKRERCCGACGAKFGGDHWGRLSDTFSGQEPEGAILALAGLVCSVFNKMAKFSIWHIVSTDTAVQSLLNGNEKTWSKEPEPGALQPESLCMLCHTFDCSTHGAYLEDDSRESSEDASGSRNGETDSESGGEPSPGPESKNSNIRQTVALPERPSLREQPHRCGFYCVDPQRRCDAILSYHGNGEVKGEYKKTRGKETGNPGFADDEFCSEVCFWEGSNRADSTVAEMVHLKRVSRFVDWSQKDLTLYKAMLATCIQLRRGPCIMATMLARSCAEIFSEILVDIHIIPHPAAEAETSKALTLFSGSTNGYKDKHYWFESSQTYDHHKRSPFVPCSHSGPCHKNPDCTCWTNKVACEWICGCDRACSRRFQGCRCIGRGAKVCFKDSNCDCWVLNRECDPWLCGKCGVLEVLDPVNRHNESIMKGRCKNAMIQRNVPKRTLKGPSEVHGWGLFAGTDIRANNFIGEYKGEVISEEESNRRGLVYHYRGLEYLFRLNRDQEIDSSRAGNKMRFINNSERASTINVYAQTMLCNGVQRIGLFAKRNLVAGEEMFFRYGYPEAVTKNFWEKEDIEATAGLEGDEELAGDGWKRRAKAKDAKAAVIATELKARKGISKQVKKAHPNRNTKGKRHGNFVHEDGDKGDLSTSAKPTIPKLRLSAPKKRKRQSSSPVIDETIFGLPEKQLMTEFSEAEEEEDGEGEKEPGRHTSLSTSHIAARRTNPADYHTGSSDEDEEDYEDEDEDGYPSDDYEEEEEEDDPGASAADTDTDTDISDNDDENLLPAPSRRLPASSHTPQHHKRSDSLSRSQRARNLRKTAAARAASLLSRSQKKISGGASKSAEMVDSGAGAGSGGGSLVPESAVTARAIKSAPAATLVGAEDAGIGAGAAAAATALTSSSTTKKKKKKKRPAAGSSARTTAAAAAGSRAAYRGAKRGRPFGWKKGVDFK